MELLQQEIRAFFRTSDAKYACAARAKGNCHHEFATLPIYFRRATARRQAGNPAKKRQICKKKEILCVVETHRMRMCVRGWNWSLLKLRLRLATNHHTVTKQHGNQSPRNKLLHGTSKKKIYEGKPVITMLIDRALHCATARRLKYGGERAVSSWWLLWQYTGMYRYNNVSQFRQRRESTGFSKIYCTTVCSRKERRRLYPKHDNAHKTMASVKGRGE